MNAMPRKNIYAFLLGLTVVKTSDPDLDDEETWMTDEFSTWSIGLP